MSTKPTTITAEKFIEYIMSSNITQYQTTSNYAYIIIICHILRKCEIILTNVLLSQRTISKSE